MQQQQSHQRPARRGGGGGGNRATSSPQGAGGGERPQVQTFHTSDSAGDATSDKVPLGVKARRLLHRTGCEWHRCALCLSPTHYMAACERFTGTELLVKNHQTNSNTVICLEGRERSAKQFGTLTVADLIAAVVKTYPPRLDGGLGGSSAADDGSPEELMLYVRGFSGQRVALTFPASTVTTFGIVPGSVIHAATGIGSGSFPGDSTHQDVQEAIRAYRAVRADVRADRHSGLRTTVVPVQENRETDAPGRLKSPGQSGASPDPWAKANFATATAEQRDLAGTSITSNPRAWATSTTTPPVTPGNAGSALPTPLGGSTGNGPMSALASLGGMSPLPAPMMNKRPSPELSPASRPWVPPSLSSGGAHQHPSPQQQSVGAQGGMLAGSGPMFSPGGRHGDPAGMGPLMAGPPPETVRIVTDAPGAERTIRIRGVAAALRVTELRETLGRFGTLLRVRVHQAPEGGCALVVLAEFELAAQAHRAVEQGIAASSFTAPGARLTLEMSPVPATTHPTVDPTDATPLDKLSVGAEALAAEFRGRADAMFAPHVPVISTACGFGRNDDRRLSAISVVVPASTHGTNTTERLPEQLPLPRSEGARRLIARLQAAIEHASAGSRDAVAAARAAPQDHDRKRDAHNALRAAALLRARLFTERRTLVNLNLAMEAAATWLSFLIQISRDVPEPRLARFFASALEAQCLQVALAASASRDEQALALAAPCFISSERPSGAPTASASASASATTTTLGGTAAAAGSDDDEDDDILNAVAHVTTRGRSGSVQKQHAAAEAEAWRQRDAQSFADLARKFTALARAASGDYPRATVDELNLALSAALLLEPIDAAQAKAYADRLKCRVAALEAVESDDDAEGSAESVPAAVRDVPRPSSLVDLEAAIHAPTMRSVVAPGFADFASAFLAGHARLVAFGVGLGNTAFSSPPFVPSA